MPIATIDKDKCIGCEQCIPACKFEALEMQDDLAVVIEDKCTNCGLCVRPCPTDAIIVIRPPKQKQPESAQAEQPAQKQGKNTHSVSFGCERAAERRRIRWPLPFER